MVKVIERSGKHYVLCPVRKKYLVLTPEEKIRQQVIEYFLSDIGYPRACLSVEKAVSLHGMTRRYDIVVYREAVPWLIVECKSGSTGITQAVFDQIGQYNMALKVPYLFVTNGRQHFILKVDLDEGSYRFLDRLPAYGSTD